MQIGSDPWSLNSIYCRDTKAIYTKSTKPTFRISKPESASAPKPTPQIGVLIILSSALLDRPCCLDVQLPNQALNIPSSVRGTYKQLNAKKDFTIFSKPTWEKKYLAHDCFHVFRTSSSCFRSTLKPLVKTE